jgi:hypothetical protein
MTTAQEQRAEAMQGRGEWNEMDDEEKETFLEESWNELDEDNINWLALELAFHNYCVRIENASDMEAPEIPQTVLRRRFDAMSYEDKMIHFGEMLQLEVQVKSPKGKEDEYDMDDEDLFAEEEGDIIHEIQEAIFQRTHANKKRDKPPFYKIEFFKGFSDDTPDQETSRINLFIPLYRSNLEKGKDAFKGVNKLIDSEISEIENAIGQYRDLQTETNSAILRSEYASTIKKYETRLEKLRIMSSKVRNKK